MFLRSITTRDLPSNTDMGTDRTCAGFSTMRYSFHAVDQEVSFDLVVADLGSYDEVLARAWLLAGDLILNEPYAQNPDLWEVRVTDSDGREVLALPLSEVSGAKDRATE